MGKQTQAEKKELTAIMDEIRSRTGKYIPELIKNLKALGARPSSSKLENNFFYHNKRQTSNYDPNLVLKIIEAYYHYVDKLTPIHPEPKGGSITILEAVLILSLTHASFDDYWQLCNIFGFSEEEVKRVVIYVLECSLHKYTWSEKSKVMYAYLEAVMSGGNARPWDSAQHTMSNIEFPRTTHKIQYQINSIEERLYTDNTADLIKSVDQIIDSCKKEESLRLLNDAIHLKGRVELVRGNVEDAQLLFEQVINAGATAYLTRKKAQANLALSLYHQGQYRSAFAKLQTLNRELSREDQLIRVFVLNLLGAISGETWQICSARAYYQEALQLAYQIEDPIRIAYLKMALGNIERYVHHYDKSLSLYEEANNDIYQDNKAPSPEFLAELAWQQTVTAIAIGNISLAKKKINEGGGVANENNLRARKIHFLTEEARLRFVQRDFESVICNKLSQAYWLSKEIKNIDLLTRSLYTLVTIRLLACAQEISSIDAYSREKLLRKLVPTDILKDVPNYTFTTLNLRRAESYFWNIYQQIPLSSKITISNAQLFINKILFNWLKPIEEAPPNQHSVVPK